MIQDLQRGLLFAIFFKVLNNHLRLGDCGDLIFWVELGNCSAFWHKLDVMWAEHPFQQSNKKWTRKYIESRSYQMTITSVFLCSTHYGLDVPVYAKLNPCPLFIFEFY